MWVQMRPEQPSRSCDHWVCLYPYTSSGKCPSVSDQTGPNQVNIHFPSAELKRKAAHYQRHGHKLRMFSAAGRMSSCCVFRASFIFNLLISGRCSSFSSPVWTNSCLLVKSSQPDCFFLFGFSLPGRELSAVN